MIFTVKVEIFWSRNFLSTKCLHIDTEVADQIQSLESFNVQTRVSSSELLKDESSTQTDERKPRTLRVHKIVAQESNVSITDNDKVIHTFSIQTQGGDAEQLKEKLVASVSKCSDCKVVS
ncbi:hypothetical protein ACFX11_036026 [Malus domestica]